MTDPAVRELSRVAFEELPRSAVFAKLCGATSVFCAAQTSFEEAQEKLNLQFTYLALHLLQFRTRL